MAIIDLKGQKFGRLAPKEYTHIILSTGRAMAAWECVCDCGTNTTVQAHHLRGGKSRSCGCLLIDTHKREGGSRKKWPEYGSYQQMINRCENPNLVSFKYYGARGIKVCERWRYGSGLKSGFECFLEDMGRRPDGMTIERKEVQGNYEPGNCKWATPEEQRVNTRRSIHAIIAGLKIPLIKYVAKTNLPYESLRLRVRRGMTVLEAARDYRRAAR